MTTPVQSWDPQRYDEQFGYVSSLGRGVLDLLAARPGERVLDLGCGTGELARSVQDLGCDVVAVDSDPAMVAAAGARLGRPAVLADAHRLVVDEPVDAVLSNAALHWMQRPADVAGAVRRALRPGGRFVAEFGGAGNVATILAAVRTAVAEFDRSAAVPWYFPTPAQYAAVLEGAGFTVRVLEYFPRSTRLADCPGGIADWLEMFGGSLVAAVPPPERPDVLARVNELCRDALFRDGAWYADYVRLRFRAVAGDVAAGPADTT